MPEITVQQQLSLPPVSAVAVMRDSLVAIKTLRVDLLELGFPDVGYVAVPIDLEIGSQRFETPSVFPITIRAQRHAEAFPMFEGQAGADANGPSSSTLWIGGEYTPPMQQIGAMIDAAVLGRVARHALQKFAMELAGAITRRGREREIREVRAHRGE
ncbi:MAG TPA: hypothetical protein VFL13_08650 [Candidatus Baltobacteraceae bacterium]|nr:hypothetical protein [Candidatus Baltobacteraceae bacterium]